MEIKSIALEFGSESAAARALAGDASLNEKSQAPAGSHASSHPDHAFAKAVILTFHPGKPTWGGGIELLASAGRYVYLLEGTAKPDTVSRSMLEGLLGRVIASG
jgi:hypothetical protein